jgi:GDP-4-dehydro-6-deoxy-D-mannose reductase
VSERILVTGASGFAGGHLLDLLTRHPGEIVAWGLHGADPGRPSDGATVVWRAVDVLDRDAVDRAAASAAPDVVYHLAGAAHVAASWKQVHHTLAVNVRGTLHLLSALRRYAPKSRIVVVGSAAVYAAGAAALTEDAPIATSSPYAVSKLAEEQLALWEARDGLDVVVARPFNHIGPRQSPDYVASSIARQIARIEAGLDRAELLLGNLDAGRDLSDVRDTVRAYQALARSGVRGRVYNICSGTAVNIRVLAESLLARSRVAIEMRVDPTRLRPTDTPIVLGDHQRLTDDTGWIPAIPMETTLDDLLEWWRAQVRRA